MLNDPYGMEVSTSWIIVITQQRVALATCSPRPELDENIHSMYVCSKTYPLKWFGGCRTLIRYGYHPQSGVVYDIVLPSINHY
jgi:hypothetical protein